MPLAVASYIILDDTMVVEFKMLCAETTTSSAAVFLMSSDNRNIQAFMHCHHETSICKFLPTRSHNMAKDIFFNTNSKFKEHYSSSLVLLQIDNCVQ